MTQGLSVSDVVQVSVFISPTAAPYLGFDLIIIGSSPVVDVNQRYRLYDGGDTALAAIATDFGTSAPEYLAADLWFSQQPQPQRVYMGRWAQNPTSGLFHGAILTPTQQQLSNFTSITTGSFAITIDGTVRQVASLNFSGALNLNGVAAIVQAALPAGVKCVWNSTYKQFTVVSSTTGATSSVSYGSTGAGGVDVSALFGLTAASGAGVPVIGVAAESLLQAVTTLNNYSNRFYAYTVASVIPPAIVDHLAVAAFIEGDGPGMYGVTISNTSVLDPTQSGDLASQLMALEYSRTESEYSSSNPYAICSYMGRHLTVDYTAQNSAMTMKFKQQPGIIAELLPESQAAALTAKNCNVFIDYANGTAITQQGTMADGRFTDEVQNLDWLANRIQTDIFNVLYQSTTKVPQTDPGIHELVNAATQSCLAAVNNGMIAEGLWTGASFGSLIQGTIIPNGFYIYAPPVASQSQTDREARKAPTLQVAVKLAGAEHFADVIINVNR